MSSRHARFVVSIIGMLLGASVNSMAAQASFDSSGASRINVSGADSSMIITTDPSLPESVNANVQGGSACRVSATAERTGDVVDVRIQRQGEHGRCTPVVRLNVREGLNLGVGLNAVTARLEGRYRGVSLMTQRADIDFNAQAEIIDLSANELNAYFRISPLRDTRLIRVKSDLADFRLQGAAESSLVYAINARDADFSKGIPESASGTRLEISADALTGFTTPSNP